MRSRRLSTNWIQRIDKWVERYIRQNARILARALATLLRNPISQFLLIPAETILSFAVDVFGLARRLANEVWEVIRSIADRALKNRATRFITGLLSIAISSFGITYLSHGIQLGAFIGGLPVALVAIPITLCAMAMSLWRDIKNLASARKEKIKLIEEINRLRSSIYKERNNTERTEQNRHGYIQELNRHLIQAEHQLRKTNLEISKYQLKCASQKRSMFFLGIIFAGIIGLAFPPVGISLIILGSIGWIHTAIKYKTEMKTLQEQITAFEEIPVPAEPEIESPASTATLASRYSIGAKLTPTQQRMPVAREEESESKSAHVNYQIVPSFHPTRPSSDPTPYRRLGK